MSIIFATFHLLYYPLSLFQTHANPVVLVWTVSVSTSVCVWTVSEVSTVRLILTSASRPRVRMVLAAMISWTPTPVIACQGSAEFIARSTMTIVLIGEKLRMQYNIELTKLLIHIHVDVTA